MQNILLLKNREEYDNAPKCELGKKVMALYEDNGLDYITNDIGSYFTATYNVTSTTNNTQLLGSNFDLSQIVSMYIDGNPINEPIKTYKFNSIGYHEIKCSFCQYDNENNEYISRLTNCENMFYYCSGLTSLDLSSFDTSKVTNMSYMFQYCSGLTSLDLSSFDTSKVTSMHSMFYYCRSLKSLDLSSFDTSKVTSMHSMFYYCSGLTSLNLSSFNTSNVTNMSEMFNNCSSLPSLDLTHFNTYNVTDMGEMFYECWRLTSLNVSSFNTVNVTDMSEMFYNCQNLTSLNVSNFNTSKVTNMEEMFRSCYNLTSLDLNNFDTSKVTNMYGMFNYCRSLTSLDLSSFNTSNVTTMGYMFSGCSYLTSIEFGNKANVSKVTTYSDMFRYLPSTTGTITYPCAYSDEWNKLLVTNSGSTYFPSTWTKQCEASEVTNKIKFIENGVELSEGNFTVNGVSCVYNETDKVWEVTHISEQQVYSILCNGVEIGSVNNSRNLNHVFIGDNNSLYTGFTITETVSASSTSTSYRLIYSSFTQYIDNMIIDGEEVTPSTSYTFSTVGEHTVQIIIDMSNVTDMYGICYMFSGCTSLTSIEFGESFDTSNMASTHQMFAYCKNLKTIKFGNSFDTTNMTEMWGMFEGCSGLTLIEFGYRANVYNVTSIGNMFAYVPSTCVLTLCENTKNSWSKIVSYLTITYNQCYTPTACTELSITAEDVKGKATSTTISYTAVTNGVDSEGNEVLGVIMINKVTSDSFEQNTDTANTVVRTITFEYLGTTATTTITQGAWTNETYSINLNNQWQLNTGITNPNSSLYDGVYQSYYNKGVHNSADICIITIEGYSTFTLYVRSNGENNYDYVVVSNLDCTLNNGTTSGSNVKATTNGKSTSDTSINSYTKVEFTNIDGGEHTIQVMYRKDGSSSSGNDRGYLLIPKEQ